MGGGPASRFLADINISPRTVEALTLQGWDIVRVSAFLLGRTPDTEILEFARREGFSVITQDLDFSMLLALSGNLQPSVITLRLPRADPETMTRKLLDLALYPLDQKLSEGVAITIDELGIRFRKLPIRR